MRRPNLFFTPLAVALGSAIVTFAFLRPEPNNMTVIMRSASLGIAPMTTSSCPPMVRALEDPLTSVARAGLTASPAPAAGGAK